MPPGSFGVRAFGTKRDKLLPSLTAMCSGRQQLAAHPERQESKCIERRLPLQRMMEGKRRQQMNWSCNYDMEIAHWLSSSRSLRLYYAV